MRGWDKVLAVQFSVLQLCCKFQAVCVSLAVKKKNKKKKEREKFLLVQQCYKTAKSPYVTLQVVSKLLPLTEAGTVWETCSCCVLCWSLSCSSLHIFNPTILLRQAAPCDQSLYTYMSSDPRWSGLSVWSRILSLTQTAALLQSSVVHFVVAVKSFSVNCCAVHSIFCLSPKEIGLSLFSLFLPFGRRPITGLFHFTSPDAEWAKEDPRGAGIFY